MTGSDGTVDSPMCQLIYRSPGCMGEDPGICDNGYGGACGGAVCDCHGKTRQTFCDRSPVPYAYRLEVTFPLPEDGQACVPNHPDAGKDH